MQISINRIPVFLSFAVLFLALPLAQAREKKLPAPDWAVQAAQTPTPASVGDAPAVVLYDEYVITVDEKNRVVERERSAIRVLKPQGRQHTQCAVSYDVDEKLNSFHAWTIAPDGRQFQAMDSDFSDHGAYGDAVLLLTERVRSVKPLANDPGAVVACETEEQLRPYMSEEEWQIQSSIPVLHQALELDLPAGGKYAVSWRKYAPVKPAEVAPNHLRWQIDNMPRLTLETLHAVPAWSSLAARMTVFWGDMAVEGVDRQWQAIGQWDAKLNAHRADPTPEITAKARELTADAPDLYTKLSRITEYIQKNIAYFIVVRGIGGWQPHYAGEIFSKKQGDCKDKATLLIAMLQAIDVHADYLHVDSRRGVLDPTAPSLAGNHMIVAIELPEGENDPRLVARAQTAQGKSLLIFDPTDEETPLGLIRPALQGAWGNLMLGDASQVLQMPVLAAKNAGLARTGTLRLTPNGDLEGEIKESFTGNDASLERSFLKRNDEKEVRRDLETSLGSGLPGLELKSFQFSHQQELSKPVELNLQLAVPAYARPSGPLLLLRPRLLGTRSRLVPDVMEGKPRAYAIELGGTGQWTDDYSIALPNGFVVDELPNPVQIDVGFASYRTQVTAEENRLHYQRQYAVHQEEIPAEKAADFRKLEKAILADEASTVVLKKQ
jgi:hypothetical protein